VVTVASTPPPVQALRTVFRSSSDVLECLVWQVSHYSSTAVSNCIIVLRVPQGSARLSKSSMHEDLLQDIAWLTEAWTTLWHRREICLGCRYVSDVDFGLAKLLVLLINVSLDIPLGSCHDHCSLFYDSVRFIEYLPTTYGFSPCGFLL